MSVFSYLSRGLVRADSSWAGKDPLDWPWALSALRAFGTQLCVLFWQRTSRVSRLS